MMTFWFLSDLERLNTEHKAIASLQGEVDWLVGCDWSLNPGLQLGVTIRIGDRDFDITLAYPDHFPFAPPIARPTRIEDRWSAHQYRDGTLCLEWGPDTWQTDLTGADMLRSAYRLLSTERPETKERTATAPSRHTLTVGQQLRGEYCRFCTTHSLRAIGKSLPAGSNGRVTFTIQFHRRSSSIMVTAVTLPDGRVWQDPEVPVGMGPSDATGVFCKLSDGTSPLKNMESRAELDEVFAACGCALQPSTEGAPRDDPSLALIIESGGAVHAYWIASGGDDHIFQARNVDSDTTLSNLRLPLGPDILKGIKIGIVGMGSVGSKVAVSLSRQGFCNFVLVDPDVLCAENVVRHQFDWSSIGDHKVDAVASTIERIVPATSITESRLHLTGQESNAALNGVLRSLSECNVLVDATGDDSVFNLLASVSTLGKVPLVWGHVFEGGFGGLLARSRPGKDLPPHRVRQLFLAYCQEHPFPQHEGSSAYSGVVDGKALVASDADVTSIASHIVSLAADAALNVEPSRYPYSLYLVGLSRGWVFEAPFHTIPISTTEPLDATSSRTASEDAIKDAVEFIGELLSRVQTEDTTT